MWIRRNNQSSQKSSNQNTARDNAPKTSSSAQWRTSSIIWISSPACHLPPAHPFFLLPVASSASSSSCDEQRWAHENLGAPGAQSQNTRRQARAWGKETERANIIVACRDCISALQQRAPRHCEAPNWLPSANFSLSLSRSSIKLPKDASVHRGTELIALN